MRQQPLRPLENEQCKSAYASPWEQLSQYNCCKQAIALKTPSPERSAPVFCNVQPVSVVPNAAAWEAVAMGKQRIKPNYRRRVLRLPDLDHCRLAVLNSLGSPASRRVYEYAINQFIAWYCSEPRLALNRIVVVRYRMYLESRGLAANTINQQLAAVRRLAHEAADSGLLSPELAAGISRVMSLSSNGPQPAVLAAYPPDALTTRLYL